jgi:hypothetical protein
VRHRGTKRRGTPRYALPADPGDLSWRPGQVVEGAAPSHWVRTDGLQVFLRSQPEGDGFTVARTGVAVSDADVAAVVAWLGVKEPVCVFDRGADSREFRCERGPVGQRMGRA